MIIKFVCSDGDLRIFETDEITYISGCAIRNHKKFSDLYGALKEGDYQLFSGTPDKIGGDSEGNINPFKVIQFKDGGGKERTVLFDNVVYICNKDGKTVEAIYA